MLDLPNTLPADQIALWCGVAAAVVCLAAGVWAVRIGLRLGRKLDIAQSLVDTHAAALEARVERTADLAETAAVRAAGLSNSAAELVVSTRKLRFLVGEVPRARRAAMRTLVDAVLPTRSTVDDDREPFDDDVPASWWGIR